MSDFNTLYMLALLLENKEIEQKFLSKVEGFQSVCMGEMRDYLRSEVASKVEALQKKNADPVRSEICDLLFNAIRITAYIWKNSIHPDADLNRLEREVEEIKAGFFLPKTK